MIQRIGFLLLCSLQLLQSAPLEQKGNENSGELATYTKGFQPSMKTLKPRDVKKSGPVKRSPFPMTASWANLLYKPAQLREKPKRSALPRASWGNQWEHFMKNPQGFRLNDADRHYLSNAVIYKRAMKHIQELNSVPMLGKRSNDIDSDSTSTEKDATTSENMFVFDPEFWRYIDSGLLEKGHASLATNDDRVEDHDLESDLLDDLGWNMEDGQYQNQLTDMSLMGDDAAYTPPAVGPHYRTILTRIQRSNPTQAM